MEHIDIHPRITAALKRAKLQDVGFILSLSAADLQRLTRLSATDVAALHRAVAEAVPHPAPVTALQILRCECSHELCRTFLSTGCPVFDTFLRGGIMSHGITEVAGESASGKTQLCLQLSLTVQLSQDSGGLSAGAMYVCTEDAFPNRRLVQMVSLLQQRCPDVQLMNIRFTDNVYVEHCADIDQMLTLMSHKVSTLLAAGKIRLVIIDSVAGLFRGADDAVKSPATTADYFIKRAKKLSSLGSVLHRLSIRHDAVIIAVNQVSDTVNAGSRFGQVERGSDKVPALGLSWANVVTTRLMLSRTEHYLTVALRESEVSSTEQRDPPVNQRTYEANVRNLKVLFAPHLPNASCRFIVDEDGVKGLPVDS